MGGMKQGRSRRASVNPVAPTLNVVDVGVDSVHSRRARAAMAGHVGDPVAALAAMSDPDPSVRLLGFGALARLDLLDQDRAVTGLNDPDTRVVRRVIESVAAIPHGGYFPLDPLDPLNPLDSALVSLLAGTDDAVSETAAWALGERYQQTEFGPQTSLPATVQKTIVEALSNAAVDHADALVRESAAAALGAIGLPEGLPAILRATKDKATVRRRAVLALASFDGPEVTAALERARSDRDWQVRQAAEDLLREQ